VDAGQKTESLFSLVEDIDKGAVVLPEFQRDFVWEIEKTVDLFDSFVREIFVGSLIYGRPSELKISATPRLRNNNPLRRISSLLY